MASQAKKATATPSGKRRPRAAVQADTPPVVESGVPLPERALPWTGPRAKYPFATMEVGNSFETSKASVRSAVKKYRDAMLKLGTVVIFEVHPQKDGTYRCWRVEATGMPDGDDETACGDSKRSTPVVAPIKPKATPKRGLPVTRRRAGSAQAQPRTGAQA
jgi:hypothetical protein